MPVCPQEQVLSCSESLKKTVKDACISDAACLPPILYPQSRQKQNKTVNHLSSLQQQQQQYQQQQYKKFAFA